MILQALNQLYDRLKDDPSYDISLPGFSLQPIAFAVVLNPDGSVSEIQDARELDGKKLRPRQLQVLGSNKPSGSGINPTLLWDTIGYLLGWTDDPEKTERTAAAFRTSAEFHRGFEAEIGDAGYTAVCCFYDRWNPERVASEFPFLTTLIGGYGAFRLIGEPGWVHERPAVRNWYLKTLEKESPETVIGKSLISGETGPIARLQAPIKGIGEKAAPLVGFNDPAYESYGKEQAFNAPVTESEAFRYTVALNALTNGPRKKRHSMSLGDMKVIFWAERPGSAESLFADVFGGTASSGGADEAGGVSDTATVQALKHLYGYFRDGRFPSALPDFDPDVRFYVIGLSPNVTRLMLRFWVETTGGMVLENFRKHFVAMRLVRSHENDPEFPSVRQVLDQTCPLKGSFPDREKIPANLEGLLLRSILTGTPYPAAVYQRILRRCQAERYQDYVKIAFMKAFLTRNHGKEFEMSLNVDMKDPGYLCGRLFAVFEKTQRDALGDTNSSVRSAYTGSASARPASVFPRLCRMYNNHLGKLNPGQRVVREKLVQEIFEKIGTSFPATLDYAEQGTFFIGFYQQMQDLYTKKAAEESSVPELEPQLDL